MNFSIIQINGINTALNESRLLGIEYESTKKIIAATFSLVMMDIEGNVPEDTRVSIRFNRIHKVLASLRDGHWDDTSAKIIPFEISQLLEVSQSFGGLEIYGWDFMNSETDDARWKSRGVSLELIDESVNGTNTISLFQSASNRTLDIKIWFDELIIIDPKGQQIELQTFIDNGERGWDAINSNNPKMKKYCIYPVK
jgi:hypothetical protein